MQSPRPECQEPARRLIDSPREAPHHPDVKQHLDECLDCQSLTEDLTTTGSLLSRAAPSLLKPVPGELRAKVLAKATEILSRRTLIQQVFDAFHAPVVRWVAAGAAAIALLMAGGMYHYLQQPVGHLDFAEYTVASVEDGKSFNLPLESSLHRRQKLSTKTGGSIITVGDSTRVALDEGTEIEVVSSQELDLDAGRVFLRVRSGEEMIVSAGAMSIRAQGPRERGAETLFGVTFALHGTQVEVAQGDVQVDHGANTVALNPGEQWDPAIPGAQPRAGGNALPAWVLQLLEAEEQSHFRQYVPSAGAR